MGDRILVQFPMQKPKMHGGILIPDNAMEKPQEAKVMAIGSGRKGKDGTIVPFEVKVGDHVLVAPFGGSEVKWADEVYTLLREDDILGIVTPRP